MLVVHISNWLRRLLRTCAAIGNLRRVRRVHLVVRSGSLFAFVRVAHIVATGVGSLPVSRVQIGGVVLVRGKLGSSDINSV